MEYARPASSARSIDTSRGKPTSFNSNRTDDQSSHTNTTRDNPTSSHAHARSPAVLPPPSLPPVEVLLLQIVVVPFSQQTRTKKGKAVLRDRDFHFFATYNRCLVLGTPARSASSIGYTNKLGTAPRLHRPPTKCLVAVRLRACTRHGGVDRLFRTTAT